MTQSSAFWRSVEAIHSGVYFAPDARERYEAIGLKGYWMGYVASRSAALGTPAPEVVSAVFHGFAPATIARALPDAWRLASRDDILTTRLDLARDTLIPALEGADTAGLARELEAVAAGVHLAGRPLAAAHVALPAPDDDIGRIWHAATVLREYRGDCHVAVLTAAGIGGAAANVLAEAAGLVDDGQRNARGWTEDEWDAAAARLTKRGWLEPDGIITTTGTAARQQIESTTDRVCVAGTSREATARSIIVEAGLLSVAQALDASGATPYPNPTGVPRP